MTHIFLIRHGETDWLGKRLAGRLPGIHLNEKGRAQAEEVVRSFAAVPIAAVYSSPLERALETAEPVAQAAGIPVVREEALQEVDFGSLEGRTFAELRDLDVWKTLHLRPGESRYPGGESLTEVQERIVTGLREFALRHKGGAVLLFSHSDTIRLALAFFAEISLGGFHNLVVDPASISALYWKANMVKIEGINWPPGTSVPWREEG